MILSNFISFVSRVAGVSAGLACFSFLWHIFIHFFYLIRRFNEDYQLNIHSMASPTRSTTHIIDNLSTSLNSNSQVYLSPAAMAGRSAGGGSSGDSIESNGTPIIDLPNVIGATHLPEDLKKTFEKASYKTDVKNFVDAKRHGAKNVEKSKIFSFNKRQPIYEHEEFDMMCCDTSNFSTIFFEVNDSGMYMTPQSRGKLDNSRNSSAASSTVAANDPKVRDMCKSLDDLHQQQMCQNKVATALQKHSTSSDNFKQIELKDSSLDTNSSGGDGGGGMDSMQNISDSRNSLLKRKGICSSQEMLHLVDIMSDHISPEQVDVLAKSLIELGGTNSGVGGCGDSSCGGAESLRTIEAEQSLQDLDRASLLERLPDIIDDKLLENIDAAIYENQIIFQERIRKNQLTIQNLKLQDQLLSKYIEDFKLLPGNDGMSVCDYENMCFTNIAHQQSHAGIKHWRNYLQDMDTNQHDDSTIQHSSFYMHTNTISNSFTDLYINENDFGSTAATGDSGQFTIDKNISTLANASITMTPTIRSNTNLMNYNCDDDDEMAMAPKKRTTTTTTAITSTTALSSANENFYMNMNMTKGLPKSRVDSHASLTMASLSPMNSMTHLLPPMYNQCQKNILVQTINKINSVDSPIKILRTKSDVALKSE